MKGHPSSTSRPSRRSVLGLLAAAPAAAALSTPDAALAAAYPKIPADLRPAGAFDRFLADRARQDLFSGSVLLVHRDRPVLARSYGMANKQRSIANGPETIFALASVGKLFTAVAIAQLVQRGKVSYHERLGTYLDGFPAAVARSVTIHQLVCHTSGMGNYRQTPEYQSASPTWASVDEVMGGIMAIIRGSDLVFPPGTGLAYSNSGYEVLGAIVATVTGQPYHDYVREHIFAAAGMTSTDFYTRPQWRDNPRIAHPYSTQPSGERADVIEQQTFVGTPAGNSFSTTTDLVRFARALLGGGLLDPLHTELTLGGKHAIPPWSDSPGFRPQASFETYAPLALLVNGQWVLLHNGGAAGESVYLEMYPDRDLISVVLSNYDLPAAPPVAAMARRLITG
ncbi:beta-lactamase family protein [Micromonospora sp. CPCC 205371]|nr:beta-lactamase family protein [Micromonospora sp. CPCC 205371]